MINVIDKYKDGFITNCINHGTAECIIPIKSLFEVIEELLQAMKCLGLPSEEVIALKDRSLKCICPQCGYTIDGAGLGVAHLVYREGVDNVHLTGRSDKLRRLLSGCCVNNSCSSQEVTLRWQDDLKTTANWILNKFPVAMKPKNQEGKGK